MNFFGKAEARDRGGTAAAAGLTHARQAESAAAEIRFKSWGRWERMPGGVQPFGKDRAVYRVHRNRVYTVAVAEVDTGHPFFGTVKHLICWRLDGAAVRSWLDLQRIKNTLIGEECTAVEVYPPQSGAIDELNMYHLWIVPQGFPLDLKTLCEG